MLGGNCQDRGPHLIQTMNVRYWMFVFSFHEVDSVLYGEQAIIAIEVKRAANIRRQNLRLIGLRWSSGFHF